jgi:hypothetical protein
LKIWMLLKGHPCCWEANPLVLVNFSRHCSTVTQWLPRGQFFKTRIGANFARRRQLERRLHCCVGANLPRGCRLTFKKLASEPYI